MNLKTHSTKDHLALTQRWKWNFKHAARPKFTDKLAHFSSTRSFRAAFGVTVIPALLEGLEVSLVEWQEIRAAWWPLIFGIPQTFGQTFAGITMSSKKCGTAHHLGGRSISCQSSLSPKGTPSPGRGWCRSCCSDTPTIREVPSSVQLIPGRKDLLMSNLDTDVLRIDRPIASLGVQVAAGGVAEQLSKAEQSLLRIRLLKIWPLLSLESLQSQIFPYDPGHGCPIDPLFAQTNSSWTALDSPKPSWQQWWWDQVGTMCSGVESLFSCQKIKVNRTSVENDQI